MHNARFTRIEGGQWVVLSPDSECANTTIVVEKRGKQPQRVAVGACIGMHKSGMWLYEIDKARGGKGPQAAVDAVEEGATVTTDSPVYPELTQPEPIVIDTTLPPPATTQPDAEALAKVLADMMARPTLDEARVKQLIAEHGMDDAALQSKLLKMMHENTPRVEISLKARDASEYALLEGTVHNSMADVLLWLSVGVHTYIVGPAGSGKTHLAQSCADALDRTLYITGAMLTKHEVLGYQTATGEYVTTAARQAYEHGGILLWDEVDASQPAALVAVNAMLSNARYTFPDKTVDRHPDFVCIAAGNTYGRGADREYVGRLQLDAATLDRFAVVEVNYDGELELALASAEYRAFGGKDDAVLGSYVAKIQTMRSNGQRNNVRHVISPRASIHGARALARGAPLARILEQAVYKGLPADSRKQIEAN